MSGSVRLAYERHGSGPRLVFLHGFTQTARSWARVAEHFAPRFEVVLVDLPGHGESGAAATDLETAADLIADVGGPAVYVGYSLGGRHALTIAVRHPQLVRGLVLLGATAGIEEVEERAARREADEALAAEIRTIGVATFLERWLANPLFAGLEVDAADRADRRRNTADGLASSLELAGTGTQAPSWATLGLLPMPVLVLAGEHDPKFIELGRRLATEIGSSAEFALVPGAGHSAHLERPAAFIDLVDRFLAALADPS